jgi:hypothetical protein
MSNSKIESLRSELQTLLKDKDLDYRAILKISNQLSKLDEKFQHFFVDAKTLIHLGRDSIKDHTTALMELVKNSYDADSFNVDVQILNNKNLLRVADNGFGMTKEQLLNNWLRIGFSNKRVSKLSDLGRRKTGEKGIGRISTDRLGANIELISKTLADGIVGLKVNWNDFDIEGKDVFDINIEITNPTSINIPEKNGKPSDTGTEIRITNLRQPWTKDHIESLYYELAALTPPFGEVEDFKISLDNDVSAEFSKTIYSDFYKASEIDVTAIFDGTDEVYYTIKDRYSTEEVVETISLNTLYSKPYIDGDEDSKVKLKSGPVTVRLLFFLREGASVKDQNFKLSDLREFLDNNAGVKIYRDQIAVKPYGFPTAQMGYDWLNLGQRKAKNPAGVGRSADYTVSPNQLVGAIFIERDQNPLLNDSAARVGVIPKVATCFFAKWPHLSLQSVHSVSPESVHWADFKAF